MLQLTAGLTGGPSLPPSGGAINAVLPAGEAETQEPEGLVVSAAKGGGTKLGTSSTRRRSLLRGREPPRRSWKRRRSPMRASSACARRTVRSQRGRPRLRRASARWPFVVRKPWPWALNALTQLRYSCQRVSVPRSDGRIPSAWRRIASRRSNSRRSISLTGKWSASSRAWVPRRTGSAIWRRRRPLARPARRARILLARFGLA